jgi:HK97 family phage major capsid protein
MTTIDRPLPTSTEVREMCMELGNKVRELREMPASHRGDTYGADLRKAAEELYAADQLFSNVWQLEKFDIEMAAFLDAEQRAAERGQGNGPTAAGLDVGNAPALSWGEQFIQSESYKDSGTRSRMSEARAVPMAGGRHAEFRNLLTSSATVDPYAGLFSPVGQPYLGNVRTQRLFIEDVLPVTQTNLPSIPYIRETTPATYEIGASSVSEGGLKPEVTMKFTRVDAPLQKIAAWIQVTTELLEDAATIRGYIDARLSYMVRLRSEQQILNGSGTSPQITGLYNSGIATSSTGADKISRIGVAIGAIENVDGYPTAVAINPTEFWTIMTTRFSTFFDGGAANAGVPYGTVPTTLWGLPAVRTRAVATNKALVGDFAQGAQVFTKGDVTVRSTDSHDDFFVLNKLVILAERRLTLAVYRPDFFVDVTLS